MGGYKVFERRTYKNPPIVEAVCTFAFSDDSHWNLTIPGRIYERVADKYPDEPEERSIMRADISMDTISESEHVRLGPTGTRMAFKNDARILTVAPRNVGIHSLAPYEGWESLRERSIEALDAYLSVVGDASITGVGLRYVNRIILPVYNFNFVEYFTVAQALPGEGFPGSITSFFDRMEVEYSDAPVKVAFTWASDDNVADKPAFIMDLDLTRRGNIGRDSIPEILDDLRERERSAFESLIQDKLREMFDADS